MKKKFTAFAVCLMMIAALACPADAAAAPRDSGVSPMAEGNGYTSDSFQYGGNYYGLYITAEYSTGSGARTKAWSSLYDHVYVKLSDVTVNYVHKNYPNTTEKGGAKAKLLITASRPSVYSGYVASSYGMPQVTKYTSINGIAYFTGVTKKTLSVTQRP